MKFLKDIFAIVVLFIIFVSASYLIIAVIGVITTWSNDYWDVANWIQFIRFMWGCVVSASFVFSVWLFLTRD